MFTNSTLTDNIREVLSHLPQVEEKRMFGGTCFMVNTKMCICIAKQHLLCRIGEQSAEAELAKDNCRPMVNAGRVMKDYVYVDFEQLHSQKDLNYWLELCLKFNPIAKASKK